MYLASASKNGEEPRCVGSRYKTPPLTGSLLKFDYKVRTLNYYVCVCFLFF